MIREPSTVFIPCCAKPRLHCRLRIHRLIVRKISFLEYNIEDTINKIFQVCWILTSGDREEKGCVVGGWGGGKCCGWLQFFTICMGQRLNMTLLKLRVLRLIANRKTCCNCTYKLVLVNTNENQCWEGRKYYLPVLRLSICNTALKKHKKKRL